MDALVIGVRALGTHARKRITRAQPVGSNTVALGEESLEVCVLLAHTCLRPARVGLKEKLRPLICGARVRRLNATAMASHDLALMNDFTGEFQFAKGQQAGIEHGARAADAAGRVPAVGGAPVRRGKCF